MEMNNQLNELTDKIFNYNPKEDSRDSIFGKHNIKKNGKKRKGIKGYMSLIHVYIQGSYG